MKPLTLKDYISRFFLFLIVVKSLMLVNYIVYPRESEKATNVTNKLETIFSVEDEVFSVLNETNISFPLRPAELCRRKDFVVMVLSAPKNTEKRNSIRKQLRERRDMQLIFLLGIPPDRGTQSDIEAEHSTHGDIVQISIKDHYTILAYKTLSGFVWINR